jgi:DNA-binding MarR family transcriptional regulator
MTRKPSPPPSVERPAMAETPSAHAGLGADLSNLLFFRLYQCTNQLHKTGTRALEENGVTTQQWAVLGALSRERAKDGMNVGDLASFLMVSRQNLAGLLTRMEAQGIIERVIGTRDNRSRLVRLTPRGWVLWRDEMQANIARFYEAALEGFANTDKIHALHYLEKLLANFRKLEGGDGTA